MSSMETRISAEMFAENFSAAADSVASVIKGDGTAVRRGLICLFAGGHLLVEGPPGLGKTTLVRCLSAVLGLQFRRVQFTPDLLPSDITGTEVFHPDTRKVAFSKGPVFTHLLLADEINRASPKTQSALLEVMAERQVTVSGVSWPIDPPFLVLATQNPVEMRGTYPLPEAQLDRFLLRVKIEYPDLPAEIAVLSNHRAGLVPQDCRVVLNRTDVLRMTSYARSVHVDHEVTEYIARIVRATRSAEGVVLGASPRAGTALQSAAQVLAAVQGRAFVTPADVKELAVDALAHRVILAPSARFDQTKAEDVISRIVGSVPAPGWRR
ncbi:ATPase associated with various cellular activities AAA_3 [Parafrankia sp. EAN1pec]|uniref:AAA family ATPase n=1 Tax=Parafrankia sp. (strain EAN1pec) TaxID=298653 RepID=UPI000054242B|nr:ATPase associated with various cellular activities AAA_3 [Frankia sp. EAN1pec]